MAGKKVTIKGRGPELFGRGIDLLFGETSDDVAQVQGENRLFAAPAGLNGTSQAPVQPGHFTESMPPAREQAYLDLPLTSLPVASPVDDYLRLAAEAFFSTYAMLTASNGALPASSPVAPQVLGATTGEPANPQPAPSTALVQPDQEPSPVIAWAGPQISASEPPMPAPTTHEGNIMPSSPVEPIDAAATTPPEEQPETTKGRKVGAPSNNGHAGGADSALSADIVLRESSTLSEQEAQEILAKLRRRDLNALDREVDALYGKTATLLSGDRKEATVAFDILRRVRLILLKEPEQYATAEYLVNQVRARINQIEQSLEGGRTYGPRIFAYQTVWMVILSVLALMTTVNGTSFSAWVAYFLGVPATSEQVNWAVLFISTLAWGGIGGVTSALWSLYHHVSVARDYDPVENLWYYSQPVLGMVLGGIVFLVMGAGFLVVQVDLAAQDVALGARMLPAAIAVVAGFRQNMVLDLIERIISVILPSQQQQSSSLQEVVEQPREEPLI